MYSEKATIVVLQVGTSHPVETPTQDAWLMEISERAHQETVRAGTQDIAAALQALFGQRIVAFMTGVEDPKAVGRWARGERTPRNEAETRLRAAYQVFQILTLADSAETARAWFIGMNPHFADRAPFAILGEDPAQAPQVLAAAKAFIVNS
jgi:hypothetical protein